MRISVLIHPNGLPHLTEAIKDYQGQIVTPETLKRSEAPATRYTLDFPSFEHAQGFIETMQPFILGR